MSRNKATRGVICAFAMLTMCLTAQAQQEKGDFEVLVFSGGFNVTSPPAKAGGFSGKVLGSQRSFLLSPKGHI